MTSTQKLVEFMLEKNRLIKAYTGINYILTADTEELRTWPEREAKQFFRYLACDDSKCCPWCARYNCFTCAYGQRNGQCNLDKNDRYSKIRGKIAELSQPGVTAIVDIPGIANLIKKKYERHKMKRNKRITTITGGVRPWWFTATALNLFETTYSLLDEDEIEQLEAMMEPKHGIDMGQVERLARQDRRWLS